MPQEKSITKDLNEVPDMVITETMGDAPSLERAQSTALAKSESQAIMGMIAQASASNVDVANMQAMWTMYKDCKAHEAKVSFDHAFSKAKPLLPKVLKKRENKQTKSRYAALEDVNDAVENILAEHGFTIRCPIIAQDEKGVTVCATLTHKDGHHETSPLWMPYDDVGIAGNKNKTMPHAVKSSITLAKSTAICALLNISMADDRGDEPDYNATVSPAQAEAIMAKLQQCPKASQEGFAGAYPGGPLTVPKLRFDEVIAMLNFDIEQERRTAAAQAQATAANTQNQNFTHKN